MHGGVPIPGLPSSCPSESGLWRECLRTLPTPAFEAPLALKPAFAAEAALPLARRPGIRGPVPGRVSVAPTRAVAGVGGPDVPQRAGGEHPAERAVQLVVLRRAGNVCTNPGWLDDSKTQGKTILPNPAKLIATITFLNAIPSGNNFNQILAIDKLLFDL